MFKFSVGQIPVEVQTSHLLFSFILAFLFSQNAFVHPAVAVISWVAVISFSVLVHELGHAWVSRSFGYRPSIVLVAMGGYTLTPAEEPIPWRKDILLTLAGPLAGYFLAVFFGVFAALVPSDNFATLHYVCQSFLLANLVWSTFNLIPIGPLDGGRIATILLTRISPKHGLLYAQLLGLLCGMPLLLWALSSGSIFMAVFVGMFMMRSLWLVVELLRGGSPPEGAVFASSPAKAASKESASGDLAHIQKLLEEGSYTEGLRQVDNLLAGALSPEERVRAHYVAGWLSIKSNQGRKALSHFSQVEGIRVPPQAMAAAFSLVGEDERALPLWEVAALESENPTLLHEWAGALLRLGREAEVRDMPHIRLSKAYLCAESVFRLRGEYAQAAQAGEASFHLEPQAEVAYEAACNYALAEDDGHVLRMLMLAAQNGFKSPQRALAEPSLVRLHGRAEFQEWIASLRSQ
jgi:Zn-dependent protease